MSKGTSSLHSKELSGQIIVSTRYNAGCNYAAEGELGKAEAALKKAEEVAKKFLQEEGEENISIYSKSYWLFVTPPAPLAMQSVRCAFFFYFQELTLI